MARINEMDAGLAFFDKLRQRNAAPISTRAGDRSRLGSPGKAIDWSVAALSGFSLGALVMAVENPCRFRLHFHDVGYAVVLGGVVAALIEETIFRGTILPIVLRHAQPMAATTITGVIFALYHGLYNGLRGCRLAISFYGSP